MDGESLIPIRSELAQFGRLGQLVDAAYGRVRIVRLTQFLRKIGTVSDEMSESERVRFERHMNSPEAQQWLADFAEQVVRHDRPSPLLRWLFCLRTRWRNASPATSKRTR